MTTMDDTVHLEQVPTPGMAVAAAWRMWSLSRGRAPQQVLAAGHGDDTLMRLLELRNGAEHSLYWTLRGTAARAFPADPQEWGPVAVELFVLLDHREGHPAWWRHIVVPHSRPVRRLDDYGREDPAGPVLDGESRPGHQWGLGPAGHAPMLEAALPAAVQFSMTHVQRDPLGQLPLERS